MWHRNNYVSGAGQAAMKPDASFENLFLSQSLHQKFNLKGAKRASDRAESAIIKYARLRIANGN